MILRKIINKLLCLGIVCTMLIATGCSNNANTDSNIDKDTNIENNIENSSSVLSDITTLDDSQVKSVETDQSFDGTINLNNNTIDFSGNGATVNDNTITITQAGTYAVSGKLEDGQIIIDTDKNSVVNLVLNGANVNCSYSSAIYSKQAKETKITILAGSVNKVTDGSEYTVDSTDTNAPTACIYSQDDLIIEGTGTIGVTGNYNDAITSKDVLTINEGVILISSADDGIVGRDALIIKNGDIKINAVGDGIKSTNDEDTTKGHITIDNGIFNITAGTDGIQAETDLIINDGSFTIITGGGSENSSTKNDNNWGNWGMKPDGGNMQQRPNKENGKMPSEMPNGTNQTQPEMPNNSNQKPPEIPNNNTQTPQQMPGQNANSSNVQSTEETVSAKGIKSKSNLIINGGSFNIDSSDDSIHSNLNITINNGDINIASGDDGIHADSTVTINDGTINITKSYEGIEGLIIDIANGTIDIVASDDGINIAGGNDGSSVNGRMGQNQFAAIENAYLNIKGGNITVDASGDGLDSNGSINLTGGNVIVYGPTNNGNGSLDYNGEFKISGGNLIAAGSAGMVQSPSNSSTQCSVSLTLDTVIDAGKSISIKDNSGNTILTTTTQKQAQNIIISSPDLKQGSSYGLYVNEKLSTEFSVTGVVTSVGNRVNGGGRK